MATPVDACVAAAIGTFLTVLSTISFLKELQEMLCVFLNVKVVFFYQLDL